MLCMHNTTTSASLDYCHKLTNPYLHQFSSIPGGNCIRLTDSLFDSQANQSIQCSIQPELLMPSPEVIDLALSVNETQPDPVRSNSKPCLLSSLEPQLPMSQLSNIKNLQYKILSIIFSTRLITCLQSRPPCQVT